MTDYQKPNYIDVKFEHFGPPTTDGERLRTRDVWYATRPTEPEFHVIDRQGEVDPTFKADVQTAWTIGKAGSGHTLIIVDENDINGLRELLTRLEQEMEQAAMQELFKPFEPPMMPDDADPDEFG